MTAAVIRWAGLVLVAVVSLAPLVAEPRPVEILAGDRPPALRLAGEAAVVVLMLVAVGVRAWADRRTDPYAGRVCRGLVVLALVLTACHWFRVDTNWYTTTDVAEEGGREVVLKRVEGWQRTLYLDILNAHAEEGKPPVPVPHVFRPLPYGFTRALERATGDWHFACLAYRAFFTFWFLWASYQFLRRYLPLRRVVLALAVFPVFHYLSILHYLGQLTDPLSNALFVLALLYVVDDRWASLAATLALGVMAKETAVLLVPAYYACHWRGGVPALLKTAGLGLAGALAFLAVRLPLGWRPAGSASLNGVPELMAGTNLGIGTSLFVGKFVFLGYVHVAIFIGVFLPFIAWKWRRTDPALRALVAVLTPLLLGVYVCFSWMYESRNYVALLPVLAAAALGPKTASERGASAP